MVSTHREARRTRLDTTSTEVIREGIADLRERIELEHNPLRQTLLQEALEDHLATLRTR